MNKYKSWYFERCNKIDKTMQSDKEIEKAEIFNIIKIERICNHRYRSNFRIVRNYFMQLSVTLKEYMGTSLVAQWLRIHLPMQGTQVRSLVLEDPTWRGATKTVRHNYWACILELTSRNCWACMPQLLKTVHLEPTLHNKRSHCNEKPVHCKEE